MLDPLNAEIRPFWNSPLKLLHLDGSLLLPAHFGRLREELSIDGLAEQSLSHVTDMQAATSHVQSGDATEEAAMGTTTMITQMLKSENTKTQLG